MTSLNQNTPSEKLRLALPDYEHILCYLGNLYFLRCEAEYIDSEKGHPGQKSPGLT